MTTNSTRILVLAVAAGLVLSACARITVAPATDAVVMLSSSIAPTTVAVTSASNIANLVVTADGTDVSTQFMYTSATGAYTAGLNLVPGMHTVVATGDVYCSYCTNQQWRPSDTGTFCVAVSLPLSGVPPKITFAQRDNQSWSSSGPHTTALATDSGAATTRWTMVPVGMGAPYATIHSAQFPCSCLRSPDNNSGTAIELAACDASDQRQNWQGSRQQLATSKGFFRFTNRAVADSGANWGCLAEGSGTTLIQSECSDTSDRLWAVFDTMFMIFAVGSANGPPW